MGRVRPISIFLIFFSKKISCQNFYNFSNIFLYQFCLILVCILHRKNINPLLKYPVFGKNFQKYKKTIKKKKKKMFLCIRPSVSNLKIISYFSCKKNNILACILALITSLLKSREHWPKSRKQQKIYFV